MRSILVFRPKMEYGVVWPGKARYIYLHSMFLCVLCGYGCFQGRQKFSTITTQYLKTPFRLIVSPVLIFPLSSRPMFSENYLKQTLTGTALVIAILLVLSLIPEFDIGSFHFKRINILSDILKKDVVVVPVDTVKIVKPVYVDTCKAGVTCVEDYTRDTSGMNVFLSGLDSSKHKLVRIAWFGDSYVEGDILLDPLRDTLQAIFGGSGVGFVPITSEVAGFRQTVIHSFSNWNTYAIVGKRDDKLPLGPAGYTFIPLENNVVSYRAEAHRQRLNQFPSAKIFYGQCTNGNIQYFTDDSAHREALVDGEGIHQLAVNQASKDFKFRIPLAEKLAVYGTSFESKTGIDVDNFSMRGNSGIGLNYVSEKMFRDFDAIHHYDLIVLSYGLNVANEKSKTYDWYVRSMKPTIAMMKRAFPNSSILVIGCSDRADNIDGELKTMPSVKRLVDVQRQMAADNQVCFWDLFEAMGGDGTMVEWANTPKHSLANKDYTHLTFYGGKKVADTFLKTILYEREKYERRKRSK